MLRKHLDLREIPTLLGSLFEETEQPFTYIACSETHAVAVVDSTLHDIRDSRDMGDQRRHDKDSTLTELWLRCNDQLVVDAAKEILSRYETLRRYDEALTYGTKHRETVARP